MNDSSVSGSDLHSLSPTVSSILGIKGSLRFRPHGSTQKPHVILRRVTFQDDLNEDEARPNAVYFSLFAQKRIEVKPGKEILLTVACADGRFKDQPLVFEGDIQVGNDASDEEEDTQVAEDEDDMLPMLTQVLPPKMRRPWAKKSDDDPSPMLSFRPTYATVGVQAEPVLSSVAAQATPPSSDGAVQTDEQQLFSSSVQTDPPPPLPASADQTTQTEPPPVKVRCEVGIMKEVEGIDQAIETEPPEDIPVTSMDVDVPIEHPMDSPITPIRTLDQAVSPMSLPHTPLPTQASGEKVDAATSPFLTYGYDTVEDFPAWGIGGWDTGCWGSSGDIFEGPDWARIRKSRMPADGKRSPRSKRIVHPSSPASSLSSYRSTPPRTPSPASPYEGGNDGDGDGDDEDEDDVEPVPQALSPPPPCPPDCKTCPKDCPTDVAFRNARRTWGNEFDIMDRSELYVGEGVEDIANPYARLFEDQSTSGEEEIPKDDVSEEEYNYEKRNAKWRHYDSVMEDIGLILKGNFDRLDRKKTSGTSRSSTKSKPKQPSTRTVSKHARMPSDGPSIDAQDMQLSPVDEGSTPAILRASSILAAASSAMTHSSTPTPRLTINTRSGTPRAATSCLTPTLQQLKSTDPFISGGFAAEFAGANNVPNVKQEPVRPAVQFSSSTPTPRSAIPLETLKPDLREPPSPISSIASSDRGESVVSRATTQTSQTPAAPTAPRQSIPPPTIPAAIRGRLESVASMGNIPIAPKALGHLNRQPATSPMALRQNMALAASNPMNRRIPTQPNALRTSPPPDPKSLAYIPSGPSSNPLGIRPSSVLPQRPIPVQKQPPTAPKSLALARKRLQVGTAWQPGRLINGAQPPTTPAPPIPQTTPTAPALASPAPLPVHSPVALQAQIPVQPAAFRPLASASPADLFNNTSYDTPSPPPPAATPSIPVQPQGVNKWKRVVPTAPASIPTGPAAIRATASIPTGPAAAASTSALPSGPGWQGGAASTPPPNHDPWRSNGGVPDWDGIKAASSAAASALYTSSPLASASSPAATAQSLRDVSSTPTSSSSTNKNADSFARPPDSPPMKSMTPPPPDMILDNDSLVGKGKSEERKQPSATKETTSSPSNAESPPKSSREQSTHHTSSHRGRTRSPSPHADRWSASSYTAGSSSKSAPPMTGSSYYPGVPLAEPMTGGRVPPKDATGRTSPPLRTVVAVQPTNSIPPNLPAPLNHPLPPKPIQAQGPRGTKRDRPPSPEPHSDARRRKRSIKWPSVEPNYTVGLKGEGDLAIQQIVFNENGNFFALICNDRTIRIWNNWNRAEIARLFHNAPVVSVAWMERDQGVVSLGDDGIVSKWTRTGPNQNQWQWSKILDAGTEARPNGELICFAYLPDRIAVSFPKGGVKVWMDIKGTWQQQRSILRHNVTSLKFIEDGAVLIGGTADGVLWQCEIPNGTLRAHAFFNKKRIYSLDINPSGTHVLVAEEHARLINIKQHDRDNVVEQTYNLPGIDRRWPSDFGAVFATRGQAVLYGTVEGCVMVWDKKKAAVVYGLEHDEVDDFIQAAASFNGSPSDDKDGCIVTGTRSGYLAWWSQPVAAPQSSSKTKRQKVA